MTKKSLNPAPRPTQAEMFRKAQADYAATCLQFNDVMTGPNPLTPEEIDRLIAKRPSLWSRFAAYGTGKCKESI